MGIAPTRMRVFRGRRDRDSRLAEEERTEFRSSRQASNPARESAGARTERQSASASEAFKIPERSTGLLLPLGRARRSKPPSRAVSDTRPRCWACSQVGAAQRRFGRRRIQSPRHHDRDFNRTRDYARLISDIPALVPESIMFDMECETRGCLRPKSTTARQPSASWRQHP